MPVDVGASAARAYRAALVSLGIPTLLGILLFSSGGYAQSVSPERKEDPAVTCLREIAAHTKWMVIPGPANGAGLLQSAIDKADKAIERDWAGGIFGQRFIRPAWVVALLALPLIVAWTRWVRRRPPQLSIKAGPKLARERKLIAWAVGSMLLAAVSERVVTYVSFLRPAYEPLRSALQYFVVLEKPTDLAAIETGDDDADRACIARWRDHPRMVSICRERWKHWDSSEESDPASAWFAQRALLEQVKAIGQRCVGITRAPAWMHSRHSREWDEVVSASAPLLDEEEPYKLDVENPALSQIIVDFDGWVTPGTGKRLDVSTAFRAGEGGFYRARLEALGSALDVSYGSYRRQSLRPLVLTLGLLGGWWYMDRKWRTAELVGGVAAAHRRWKMLHVAAIATPVAVLALSLLWEPLLAFVVTRLA